MRRALAITLALFVLVYVVAAFRYAPPPPAPADAPRERFSATRAHDVHQRLVGDGATRFLGTDGNARARGVITTELEKAGWVVETQRATSCTYHGMCAPITNVVAHLPGREPALPGVLISAHYDSVLAGAGASDDGMGTVTILETARALTEGPRPRRTVVALLADGEEAGLLGADAFVRGHPRAASVRTTVNVDARGSHGPSQMFETSRGNAWLVSLMAQHLERPVTSSLFYEVYKRMPNDTDFSVTKTIASGVNFANTAGIDNYHTPLDALDVADPGTLQHHGDHVLGMTRALAESDGPRADAAADDVWFDVMAIGIVHWPARWTMLMALVALALVLGQTIRARAFDRGLFVLFASLVPGVVAAGVVGWLLGAAGALPALWVAHPSSAQLAIHAAAAGALLAVALLLASKATPRALWSGTWLGWGAIGAGTAAVAPGASYLFVVPTLAAALCGSLPLGVASAVPAAVAATLILALATGIYDALGFAVPPLVALPTLLLATTLAPMLAGLPRSFGRRVPLALVAVTVFAMLGALVAPKFSSTNPQRVNVVHRQDETGARVFVDTSWGPASWGAPPASMLAALGPSAGRDAALPWTLAAPFADAPPIDALPPVAEILETSDAGGRRHARVRLRSPRHAPTIAIFWPTGRHVEVKVDARFAFPRPVTNGSLVALLAVPPEGIVVDFEATGAGVIPLTLLDRSTGVPAGSRAASVVGARPKEATPSQDGDVTVLTTKLSL